MNKPKVELKKLKTFQGMEGLGFNVEVWINEVNCMFAIDEGNGGEMIPRHVRDSKGNLIPEVETNIKALEDYIKTLPKLKTQYGELTMDLALYIDEMLIEYEKAKHMKKLEKLFATALVIGSPDASQYRYLKYKKPLNTFPKAVLEQGILRLKSSMKKGEVFLNNNLQALGLII